MRIKEISKHITTVLLIIITILIVIIISKHQNNTKFNNIIQINLNQIYQSINIADENIKQELLPQEEIVNTLINDCYTATKTICEIKNSDYNLDDFYFFLLYLREFGGYKLEEKEKIIHAINLINEEFYSVGWNSTKGLGIRGYYDFIENDIKDIRALVETINNVSRLVN